MASNEEPETRATSHPSSNESNRDEPQARPDSQPNGQSCKKAVKNSMFSHPGARRIAQRAEDGDGPYLCRKCGEGVLTVSVIQCPACLDNYPWFAPADA